MRDKKPSGYWTYDRCFAEAKKYKLRADFKKNAAGAYDAAKDKGWLIEYTWLESRPLKWTYNTCIEEAKKYRTRSEFSKEAGSAYNVARKNDWLKDYTWFEELQKPGGYWTYETCYEEAKKYKSRGEFSKKSQTAYNRARIENWLDDFSWLASDATPAGFWTYEKCFEEAKKYKTRIEFSNQAGYVYKLTQKNGWFDDYTWLEKKFVWSFEKCSAVAKQYKTKKDFKQGNSGAYSAASKHGWLKHFDWLKSSRINVITDEVDNVYMYYFENFNAVYIGRTVNIKRRDREHVFNTTNDSVAKFAFAHDCPVPPMILLEENLSIEKGQEREDYWRNYYEEHGYKVLNKAKTGVGIGSIGSIGGIKWTKQACYNEAKKYTHRKEFQRESVGAYTQALKRGWLKDYTWFERPKNWNQIWDRDTCYEEALKYTKLSQFEKNSSGACNAARKHGWIKEYTWFESTSKPVGYWTYEKCFEEAKKFRSRNEFKKGAQSAYGVALAKGWLDDYTWFVRKRKSHEDWTYERCYEEAKKYKTKAEFANGKGSAYAYRKSRLKGWINDFDWLEEPSNPLDIWTYERCKEESKKHKTKADFIKEAPAAYRVSLKYEWIKDFVWLETRKLWTYPECFSLAQAYTTKKEFRKAHPAAYTAAKRYGWLKEFKWLKVQFKEPYWTKERCYEEAKKYSSKQDFSHSSGAYRVAYINGWLNDYDWLVDTQLEKKHIKKKWTEEACFNEAQKYTSKSAFKSGNESAYSAALKSGWLKDYTWFTGLRIPESYWTYERCCEEARECKTKKEFYQEHDRAYRIALRNRWMDKIAKIVGWK
ncbi:MAG: hypothetical protein IJV34_01735 [Prevotella sp.]|nr:hypothetical protein [Prevotella sp.]